MSKSITLDVAIKNLIDSYKKIYMGIFKNEINKNKVLVLNNNDWDEIWATHKAYELNEEKIIMPQLKKFNFFKKIKKDMVLKDKDVEMTISIEDNL